MASTQNPATLAACGASVTDLAGASIYSENSHSIRALQVARLTQSCAITEAMAEIVAPLTGEVSRGQGVDGTGYWFRNRHEQMLVGTRGNVPAPAPGTSIARDAGVLLSLALQHGVPQTQFRHAVTRGASEEPASIWARSLIPSQRIHFREASDAC